MDGPWKAGPAGQGEARAVGRGCAPREDGRMDRLQPESCRKLPLLPSLVQAGLCSYAAAWNGHQPAPSSGLSGLVVVRSPDEQP